MYRTLAVTLLVLLAGCASPGSLEEIGRSLPAPPDGGSGDDPEPIVLAEGAPATGRVAIHVLDVGQGDGTVWELPGGGLAIYDCGGGREVADEDPMLGFLDQELGLAPGATIDLMVVSHGHLDHLRECEEVLERYQVEHIVDLWYTGDDRTQAYRAFQAAALEEGATLWTVADLPGRSSDRRLAAGDRLPLPASTEQAGVVAQVLWPPGPTVDHWGEVAEGSLMVRLSHGTVDTCFQGDISTAEEADILTLAPGIECEGYLVGHHGSAHASSRAWLEQLDPQVAVVSFGDNPYGHPTSEALCRVQSAGADVYATHRLGTVSLTSDGSNLTVTPDQPETQAYCQAGASYWGSAPSDTDPAPESLDGTLTVEAEPSDPEPCRYTDVTIVTRVTDTNGTGVANATVRTTWHYKTSAPDENATTDDRGWANVTRYISGASAGYTVEVEVQAWTADHGGQTTTRFTPQTC